MKKLSTHQLSLIKGGYGYILTFKSANNNAYTYSNKIINSLRHIFH